MNESGTLLLIDKPKGITSFDVIRLLRKKLNIRKMGHSGTLDPLATGLMLIATGSDTKKLTSLIGLPKTYEAEITLGIKTDTGDITGAITEEKLVPVLSPADLEMAVRDMVGEHHVKVPLYSAIKKDGRALYKYAREGTVVEAPVKVMHVTSAKLLSHEGTILKIFFDVSSGTYIRTLAEVLAERLGTVGTISNLRRLSIGVYTVANAEKVDL